MTAVGIGVAAWGPDRETPSGDPPVHRSMTHRFDPAPTGLVENVFASDPFDLELVGQVQDAVAEEQRQFADGDFSDPMSGQTDLAGLDELEAAAEQIDVRYVELADGARLTFEAPTPELVNALQSWAASRPTHPNPHAGH